MMKAEAYKVILHINRYNAKCLFAKSISRI